MIVYSGMILYLLLYVVEQLESVWPGGHVSRGRGSYCMYYHTVLAQQHSYHSIVEPYIVEQHGTEKDTREAYSTQRRACSTIYHCCILSCEN